MFNLLHQPIPASKKRITSNITYKDDKAFIDEFRMLCSRHGIRQTTIIRNAIKQAMAEMRAMEVK